MPAVSIPEAAAQHAPEFKPVPGRARRDGWTAERQRAFIAALAKTFCVAAAAQAAGMSRKSAYRLRRRRHAESFAAAWDWILAARPRGTSSPALVWHRLVRKAGGRSAVRIEDATPAEWAALRGPRPSGRKVTMKLCRAFRELHHAAALQRPGGAEAAPSPHRRLRPGE